MSYYIGDPLIKSIDNLREHSSRCKLNISEIFWNEFSFQPLPCNGRSVAYSERSEINQSAREPIACVAKTAPEQEAVSRPDEDRRVDDGPDSVSVCHTFRALQYGH
jgi:hypothetical protein